MVFHRALSFRIIRSAVQLQLKRKMSNLKPPGVKTTIDNFTIHYEQVGTGENAVILLPGAIGSSRTDFTPQIEKLDRTKFTVVAWDPPGYGFSRPPERTFASDFFYRDARVASQLMQKLGHKTYSVVGWSDGGTTGIIMAGQYPDAVKKLIVWGCGTYVVPKDGELVEATRDISKWSEKMRKPMIEMYGEENFQDLWSRYCDAFQSFLKLGDGDICTKELSRIKCPTLIIHGVKDPLIAPEHHEFLLKHIRLARLYLMPEGKHNLHLRYADEFNKVVTDFILG